MRWIRARSGFGTAFSFTFASCPPPIPAPILQGMLDELLNPGVKILGLRWERPCSYSRASLTSGYRIAVSKSVSAFAPRLSWRFVMRWTLAL